MTAASAAAPSTAFARDAASDWTGGSAVFCTDPPYYDNVPYADLSDFFYIWLRASLGAVFPNELATLLVPKATELVADVTRFGGSKERAREFFERGLGSAFRSIRQTMTTGIPATIFYAFKQTEDRNGGDDSDASRMSHGWEAMLNALLQAEFR